MRAPCQKDDVVPGLEEPASENAADGTGPVDDESHDRSLTGQRPARLASRPTVPPQIFCQIFWRPSQ